MAIANGEFLKNLLIEIANEPLYPIISSNKSVTVKPDVLLTNLRGSIGSLYVRTLYRALQVNEDFPFKWRLENKYVQYLIFSSYLPLSVPETISLSDIVLQEEKGLIIDKLLKKGYFLKSTLGHSSGDDNSFDRTSELQSILQNYNPKESRNFDEVWVLQQKLNLKKEFRVHSFGQDVIQGLSFERYGLNATDNFVAPEEFVKHTLAKLPASITHGCLIGWDVGVNFDNQFYIIEANYTGFHPVYKRGFQTSGYFQDNVYGPISCLRLNLYFKNKYGLSLCKINKKLITEFQFMKAMDFHLKLENGALDESIPRDEENEAVAGLLYAGRYNAGVEPTTLSYLKNMSFIQRIYIVSHEESFTVLEETFKNINKVFVIEEEKLFEGIELELFSSCNDRLKREIIIFNAHRIVKEKYCIFFKPYSIVVKHLARSDFFIDGKIINFKHFVLSKRKSSQCMLRLLKLPASNYEYEDNTFYKVSLSKQLSEYITKIHEDFLVNIITNHPTTVFSSVFFNYLENSNLYYLSYLQCSENYVKVFKSTIDGSGVSIDHPKYKNTFMLIDCAP
ncbi:hypothetical protein ACTHQF_00275 [Pedobacter sp. SAFR-022]|uniref:hypothetical protein n=1 Tax=Pedobacter sp. SAFR-022 TaxID=3436861 RepID=UPI003F806384